MKRLILVVIVMLCVRICVRAQSVSEFWGGAYPQLQECGPAVAAMGGAGVALPGEIGAAILNPATLGVAKGPAGWRLALDATLTNSVFHQDALLAHKAYIGQTGQLVSEVVVGSTNSQRSLRTGYNALVYASDCWAIGLVVNRSLAYQVPFQKNITSIVWFRRNLTTWWYSSPQRGQGNLQEDQYAIVAAFRPSNEFSIGVGAICVANSANISTTFYDPDFINVASGKEATHSSAQRFVPLVGLLWHTKNWSLAVSYEGGFSVPMTVERVALTYTKMVGEYRHPPRASIGVAYTSGNFQASLQADHLWSELHTDQLSAWYPAEWFRTDNSHAYRAGMKFSGVGGINGLQIMVGVAYVRNNGLYLKPGVFSNVPKNAPPYYSAYLGYYLALTYPKHEPLTTVSCGALIKVNKHISVIPEVQASRYSKAARIGVVVDF